MDTVNSSNQQDQFQDQRKKRDKRHRANLLAMVVLVVVTVAFTIWSLIFILARHQETTRLAFITKKMVEESTACSVVFINRNEELLAPADGILVPLVQEGDRVAKGTPIALVVHATSAEEVKRYIQANDACDARKMILVGLSNTVEETLPKTRSDSLMREAISTLNRSRIIGDLSELQRSSKLLGDAIAQYRSEPLKGMEQDETLKELLRERDRLLERLEASVAQNGVLTAPIPGTVSYYSSIAEEIKDESYWKDEPDPLAAIERLSDSSLQPVDSRQTIVKANAPVATISNASSNTIIAITPHNPDEENRPDRGDSIDLILSEEDGRIDRCRISRVVRGEHLDRLFLSAPIGLEPASRQTVFRHASMSAKRTTGLSVPIRSLIDFNLETGIAKLKKITGGVTETISVKIVAVDGTYAIIENLVEGNTPLKEADLFVVNPWTIGEGVLID